jgi:hypothetical protein
VRRCPSPTWSAPKRRKRRKSSRNVTAAGMGAAVSSGGRVLVCAARYADGQHAYIIEDKHNIPHVLTLRMSQRDGFGLPAYAQNKRKAQQHLLSAVEGHSSRLVYRSPLEYQNHHVSASTHAKEEVHRLEEEKFRLEEEHQQDMWAAKHNAQRHLLSAVEGHSSRRLLAAAAGTNVDVEIKVKSEKEATKAAANLTPSNINKELSAAGEF